MQAFPPLHGYGLRLGLARRRDSLTGTPAARNGGAASRLAVLPFLHHPCPAAPSTRSRVAHRFVPQLRPRPGVPLPGLRHSGVAMTWPWWCTWGWRVGRRRRERAASWLRAEQPRRCHSPASWQALRVQGKRRTLAPGVTWLPCVGLAVRLGLAVPDTTVVNALRRTGQRG